MIKFRHKTLLAIALGLGTNSWASPQIERNLIVSDAFEARSTFHNPAALGFQTALNGSEFLSGITYGVQDFSTDEYSYAISYGYLGFGMEHLAEPAGRFSRYTFAFGNPLGPYVYTGTRFSFTRSDAPTLDGMNAVDFGVQIRPHRQVSFGILLNRINRPQVGGATLPMVWAMGFTVRPIDNLSVSFDWDTPSDAFYKDVNYAANATWEVSPGFYLRAGYHSVNQLLVGLQWNIGRTSVFANAQSSSTKRSAVTGLQFSFTPQRSFLKSNTNLKVDIDGSLREAPSRGGILAKERPGLIQTLALLDKAKDDSSVKTIILRIDDFPLGMAAAQDVCDSLWRAREAGKRIEVFLNNSDLKEYLIASVGHEIHMEPTAELRFTGLKADRYFIKGTLDKLGVQGEFLARGKYKSAPETFTRTDSSPISREEILRSLGEAEKLILSALEKTGRIDAEKWKKLQNEALLSPEQAKEWGLIDSIDHFASALDTKKWKGPIREDLKERSTALALPPRIAVIIAQGDILRERVQLLSLAGRDQITPAKMERHFKAAASDLRTKAIVFRVSSGGGEVLASDQIASLVEIIKKDKPVFASMGDAAASGGYFIAAPANKIFAQPLTITGSIGVFLGKFNLGGLYKKIELNKEVLTHAPYGGLYSENKAWTKEELTILNRRLNQFYDNFVDYVSKSRTLTKNDVDKVAQGRVWLGAEALTHRLVDETTGYYGALMAAAKETGVPMHQLEIWPVEDTRGLLDILGDDTPFMAIEAQFPKSLLLDRPTLAQIGWLGHLREEPFLLLSPLERIE